MIVSIQRLLKSKTFHLPQFPENSPTFELVWVSGRNSERPKASSPFLGQHCKVLENNSDIQLAAQRTNANQQQRTKLAQRRFCNRQASASTSTWAPRLQDPRCPQILRPLAKDTNASLEKSRPILKDMQSVFCPYQLKLDFQRFRKQFLQSSDSWTLILGCNYLADPNRCRDVTSTYISRVFS